MCLNEMYSKACISKHLSDTQNYLKQGDVLSPLLLNFALEYAIRKTHKSQVGLKLNEAHQLLAYADDVNLLGDNIDTIKKTNFDASKEIGLEVKIEKTNYILLSHHQNARKNYNIKTANRSFENVAQVK
jgi:hypothetical protein